MCEAAQTPIDQATISTSRYTSGWMKWAVVLERCRVGRPTGKEGQEAGMSGLDDIRVFHTFYFSISCGMFQYG